MKNVRKIGTFICVLTLFFMLFPLATVNATTKEQYKVSGKVIKPVVQKGKDISKNVNAALKIATKKAKKNSIYTVKIPAGTYYITESLKIRSNTILDATGCTIKAKGSGFNMVATGSADENQKARGYSAYKNITIKGGKWINTKSNKASAIRLCRGTNITLKNIDMSHGSEKHMVEMAAVNGVKITGCRIHDSNAKDLAGKCEAVQLDICANEGAYSSVIYDGTPCKNVTIDSNTFENVSRGVGTHSMLLNSYIANVKITNNKFVNVTQEAIGCVNYVDSLISGNTMENVGGGILFHFSKTSNNSIYTAINNGKKAYVAAIRTNANTVIENNKIETRYHKICDKNVGIELYGRKIKEDETGADKGKIPAADYYVEGVTVQNNQIRASGYGINLNDAKNNSIIGNTIHGANYDLTDPLYGKYNGIRVSTGSTGNVINSNMISGINQSGILIYDHSSATTVDGNRVKDCTTFGIRLNNECKVTQSMKNNEVSGCPQGAILDGEKSGCYVEGGISNNVIR